MVLVGSYCVLIQQTYDITTYVSFPEQKIILPDSRRIVSLSYCFHVMPFQWTPMIITMINIKQVQGKIVECEVDLRKTALVPQSQVYFSSLVPNEIYQHVDICIHVVIHVMQFIWGPKFSDVDMCFPVTSVPIEDFESNPRNCFFSRISSCCGDSLFSECHCVILGFLLPNIITSRCFKPKEIGITFISMLFTNSFQHL